MVGIAAERPVDLPAAEGQEKPDDAQGLRGLANCGDTGPYVPADGAETGVAASAIPRLKVQVKSGNKGTAFHGGVKDGPGDQRKIPGDREEALVDAYGVDHAPQPLIVSVGIEVGDVTGFRQLRDGFSDGSHGQLGQRGQRGQRLPAKAQGVAAAVQNGPKASGTEAERCVQDKLIRQFERSVEPTRS